MEDDIQCPDCDRWFCVVWNNDGQGPPEFCPMCGYEFDYREAAEKARKKE